MKHNSGTKRLRTPTVVVPQSPPWCRVGYAHRCDSGPLIAEIHQMGLILLWLWRCLYISTIEACIIVYMIYMCISRNIYIYTYSIYEIYQYSTWNLKITPHKRKSLQFRTYAYGCQTILTLLGEKHMSWPVRRFKNNLGAFHDAALVDDGILTFMIDRNTGSCFTSCIASTTTQPIAIDQRSPEFVDNTKSLVGLHYKHLFFCFVECNHYHLQW